MPAEPAVKRAIAFFDGQNLFYAARHAFGYSWPMTTPGESTRLIGSASTASHTMPLSICETIVRRGKNSEREMLRGATHAFTALRDTNGDRTVVFRVVFLVAFLLLGSIIGRDFGVKRSGETAGQTLLQKSRLLGENVKSVGRTAYALWEGKVSYGRGTHA